MCRYFFTKRTFQLNMLPTEVTVVISSLLGICNAYSYSYTSNSYSVHSPWWFWPIVGGVLVFKCACIGCWYKHRQDQRRANSEVVFANMPPQVPPPTQTNQYYNQDQPAYPVQAVAYPVQAEAFPSQDPAYQVQTVNLPAKAYYCPPPNYSEPTAAATYDNKMI